MSEEGPLHSIESRPAVTQQWFIDNHRIDIPDNVHQDCNCSNNTNCSDAAVSLQKFHPPVTMNIRHITTKNSSKRMWVCIKIPDNNFPRASAYSLLEISVNEEYFDPIPIGCKVGNSGDFLANESLSSQAVIYIHGEFRLLRHTWRHHSSQWNKCFPFRYP